MPFVPFYVPSSDHPSLIVKRSVRHTGSSYMWWFTIMAPSEVMARVDRVWHVLEMRASWSLLHSLSSRHSSLHMDRQSSQVSVTTHQAPLAVTVPITSSSSAKSLHNSSEVPLAPLNPEAPVFHLSSPEELQTSVSGGTPATNTMEFPHSGKVCL